MERGELIRPLNESHNAHETDWMHVMWSDLFSWMHLFFF
jgi:hypothetical protein